MESLLVISSIYSRVALEMVRAECLEQNGSALLSSCATMDQISACAVGNEVALRPRQHTSLEPQRTDYELITSLKAGGYT
jgi:hypothetical protein